LSKERLSGLVIAQKILGIIVVIIGISMSYYTYNNMDAAGLGANLFIATGIALAILGLILIIARVK